MQLDSTHPTHAPCPCARYRSIGGVTWLLLTIHGIGHTYTYNHHHTDNLSINLSPQKSKATRYTCSYIREALDRQGRLTLRREATQAWAWGLKAPAHIQSQYRRGDPGRYRRRSVWGHVRVCVGGRVQGRVFGRVHTGASGDHTGSANSNNSEQRELIPETSSVIHGHGPADATANKTPHKKTEQSHI